MLDRRSFLKLVGITTTVAVVGPIVVDKLETTKAISTPWTHVALTRDTKSKLYLNGELQGTVENFERTVSNILKNCNLQYNKVPADVTDTFSVWVKPQDDCFQSLRLYDRRLTKAELEFLYKAGVC